MKTDDVYHIDPDIKRAIVDFAKGRRIDSLEFIDSIGGEEVRILLDDGRLITLEVTGEYIHASVLDKVLRSTP